MERSKELSFSVRNSEEVSGQPAGYLVGNTPGFVGDLQVLAGEELEARLQIHDRIGGGSSARVYRGTLDGTMPVAIKVLHPHAAQRESTVQEFLREAQVLARLQNRHIVRLHALAHLPPNFAGLPTRRHTWGIVTEYMEAGTLTRLVQDSAKIVKLQQRIKRHIVAAAAAAAAAGSCQSVGGHSAAAASERSNSTRTLRPNLSFLRRRSLTANCEGATAPPSPHSRGGAAAAVNGNGGGDEGASARLDSLTREMPSLPYSDREALQWCMEVALALQFLHAQTPPIVHRDVKTDNVLMAPLPPGAVASPSPALPPGAVAALRASAADVGGDGGAAAGTAAAAALGTCFTAGGEGSMTYGTHGSLARRVLSVRAAAAAAAAGGEAAALSRMDSFTTAAGVRPCDGQPLTAKLCDFGLHVILDLTRPIVNVCRRSYEHMYGSDLHGPGSLPYSNSMTQRSARNSPAGSVSIVGTALLSPSGTGGGGSQPPSGQWGQLPGGHTGTALGLGLGRLQDSRSRRSSLVSSRALDEHGLLRHAVSRDGDSFTRIQPGVVRKVSNLSHADSTEHPPAPAGGGGVAALSSLNTHALTVAAAASGSGGGGGIARSAAAIAVGGSITYSSSPPKPGPFAGGGGAAAAAAATAFGSHAGSGSGGSGGGRMSSGAVAPVVAGLRGSGGGAYCSPKTSGLGSGPGPPKWSGGNIVTAAHHGGLSGFAATRASLELLLQGRLSATAALAAASQSTGSAASVIIATGGGSSVPGMPGGGGDRGGGSSTAPLLPTSVSHVMAAAAAAGAMESLSAGQMMLQLHAGGSNTGMLERVSRLRPSQTGPATGELGLGLGGGGGGGTSLEAMLRLGVRSSSGRPSAAAAAMVAALAAGSGGSGGNAAWTETGMYGSVGAVGARTQRPSTGSPANSARGGGGAGRIKSNAAQVEKYLQMMEQDLNLDLTSRSSSKAQTEMEPLCALPSRQGSQTAAGSRARSGVLGGGGGGITAKPPSSRRLLLAGSSLGSLPPGTLQAMAVAAGPSPPQQQVQLRQVGPSSPAGLAPRISSPKTSLLPAVTERPSAAGGSPAAASNALAAPGGEGASASAAVHAPVPDRALPSGSGSSASAGTLGTPLAGRISSVGPNSPNVSPGGARVASTASTQSEMIVLTGVTYSGFGGQPGATSGGGGAATDGGSAGTCAPGGSAGSGSAGGGSAGGSGGIAAGIVGAHGRMVMLARGPNPMKASSQPALSVSTSTITGAFPYGGPSRGPNPMKSSSQPAMYVNGSVPEAPELDRSRAAAAGLALTTGPLSVQPGGGGVYTGMAAHQSPPRGPNPIKSSSQPAMCVIGAAAGATAAAVAGSQLGRGREGTAAAAAAALMRSTSSGSRMMSHLGLASATSSSSAVLASPPASVHAMDLSPLVARPKSSRMGQAQLHGTATSTTSAAGNAASGADGGELATVEGGASANAITTAGVAAGRRNRLPLVVTLPEGSAGGVGDGAEFAASASGGMPPPHALSLPGGSRGGSTGGGAAGVPAAAAAVAGRHWVATATTAASPRTHSPNASAGAGGGGGGAVAPGGPAGPNLQTTESSTLPLPPAGHSQSAATGVVLNRELHKVVKRLRPDGGGGGGSFTGSGNSPLGLPPTAPIHHGSGGGGEAAGGPFTYSRRSSMDFHAPSYQSIGSARSATAALQIGGSSGGVGSGALHLAAAGGGGGSLPTLHREKLLWSRGALAASSSAGHSGGGASPAAFNHSGPVQSVGAVTSDPNSPVSSCGAAAGSSSLLGRTPAGALLRHPPGGPGSTLMGPVAAGGGGGMPRTTSGGVSAGCNSGRQSSTGERTACQLSLVRHSSSTHSWGDPGAPGGAASTAAAVAHVLSAAVGGGGGGGGGGGASCGASPSCTNTATSIRVLAQPGPCGSVAALAPPSVAAAAASGGGTTHSALAAPMLARVIGAPSQTSSAAASMLPQRMISESAASSTLGGWTGRDELPAQGEAAYALTGRAGTLIYMAPEVIRHEPYNEKVDVFSFGVVLYEVFGRVLLLETYNKDELEALGSRISQGIRHSRPDCMPQVIWDLVQQCWAQNPADRPSMPLVVRQMELALEAMDEADAAAVVSHSSTHRASSLVGDGGGAVGLPSGSAVLALGTGGGTGLNSAAAAAGGKDRCGIRSGASHKSLLRSLGSLGRGPKPLTSFRRRAPLPRSAPQPTAPTPGRPPPTPATALSAAAVARDGSSGLDSPRSPGSAAAAGGGLHSPTLSRGAVGPASAAAAGAMESSSDAAAAVVGSRGGERFGVPRRCAPCGCVIC